MIRYIWVLILVTNLFSQFQPQNSQELETAVNLWVDDNESALIIYGEINTWDVSLITDMYELFRNKETFNDDIGNWDVSNVTNMGYMFYFANNFNQDLSSWDVVNVTNMFVMFYGTALSGMEVVVLAQPQHGKWKGSPRAN